MLATKAKLEAKQVPELGTRSSMPVTITPPKAGVIEKSEEEANLASTTEKPRASKNDKVRDFYSNILNKKAKKKEAEGGTEK